MLTRIKTPKEIAAMRTSGKMNASILITLKEKAQPGMTTKELADIAAAELQALGGKPTFLGYEGFKDILCVSVNDEVVHGIPSRFKTLETGDVVSLDFGVTYEGMITDHAITFVLGGTKNRRVQQLVETTERAMMAGIGMLHDGVRVGDIAHTIEKALSRERLGIVRDLVGHATGHELHEEPNIPNYGRAGTGPTLVSGMTVAIEPMATLGTDRVWLDDDGWTVHSGDGSLAAHFEHTILITGDGWEILTQPS
jgi:methionyl aminopeptidase